MKLINIPGTTSWVNPDHIIKINPDTAGRCIVYLTGDGMLYVPHPIEKTVKAIQEAVK